MYMENFKMNSTQKIKWCLLILICSVSFGQAWAQSDAAESSDLDALDLDQIEAELDKGKTENTVAKPAQEEAKSEPQNLSDLGRLAPFSEVSVLQKRFQPKTGRFQFGLGLGGIANDPWFQGLGSSFRGGYHFSESWALEGVGTFLSSSERDSAKDLFSNMSVSTSSIVTTKSFYGADILWSPIYGKMSLFNNKILPFDMYFSLGAGQSTIDGAKDKQATTFHLGTGQVFALSKSWGFRWDISWNTFSATQVSSVTGKESKTQFNNVILMLGASFFIPEVKYR